MKIKIGADELILWLRKNKIASCETTIQLGKKIRILIESLGGELTVHDVNCNWNTEVDSVSIDELQLPKTATQYSIDSSKMGELYVDLSGW